MNAAIEEGADFGAVVSIVGSSPETLRRHYQHVTNRLRRQTVALIKTIELPSLDIDLFVKPKRKIAYGFSFIESEKMRLFLHLSYLYNRGRNHGFGRNLFKR